MVRLLYFSWLILFALTACEQEQQPVPTPPQGERQQISLALSADLELGETRSFEYQLGQNKNGQQVPMPTFTPGQKVLVHMILKSDKNAYGIASIYWTYDAEKRRLVLKQSDEGNNIEVTGFTNDAGTRWYVSGLIGGSRVNPSDPTSATFAFEGERELTGVQQIGDAISKLKVPYAFPWTEVTIETNKEQEASGSYKYGFVPQSAGVTFKPRGALIAYKLGNDLPYGFKPTGFYTTSDAFVDQGVFDLNTEIVADGLPAWSNKANNCGSVMEYFFSSATAPSTALTTGQMLDKVYYAWVMPVSPAPTMASTKVILRGEAPNSPHTDYTKAYYTSYTPNAVSGGKVVHGKVHPLTARATANVVLPIQLITDYNLAGGPSYGTAQLPTTGHWLDGAVYDGVQGELRFSNTTSTGAMNPDPHDNKASGYYNWFMVQSDVANRTSSHFNPNSIDLHGETLRDEDGQTIRLGDKYYVPHIDNLWGVFPGYPSSVSDARYKWYNPSASNSTIDEIMSVGQGTGAEALLQSYRAQYSNGRLLTTDINGEAVIYAIRFAKKTTCDPTYYDFEKEGRRTYTAAPNDMMKCAYRYQRVGLWNINIAGAEMIAQWKTRRFKIEVVYLGEEAGATPLDDGTSNSVASEAWWNARRAEGKVISKTFSVAGAIRGILRKSSSSEVATYNWADESTRQTFIQSTSYDRSPIPGSTGAILSYSKSAGAAHDRLIVALPWFDGNGYSVRLFKKKP